MNASKENARLAYEALSRIIARDGPGEDERFVREFIDAAQRNLPCEESIADDKAKKRMRNIAARKSVSSPKE